MANSDDNFWGDLGNPSTKPADGKPAAGGAKEDDNFWGDLNKQPTQAEVRARAAQPTEFEKAAASDVHPVKGMLTGFGKGALEDVGHLSSAIHAIPYVGPKLIPSEGLAAEKAIATPQNANERAGEQIETVAEGLIPFGEAADAFAGSKYLRPAARFLDENVLRQMEHIPYVGASLRAAENAPNFVKAAIRGGTTGATLGGIEQAIRTRDPFETAKGALYGGLTGATIGAGAHGISKVANAVTPAEANAAEITGRLPAVLAPNERGVLPERPTPPIAPTGQGAEGLPSVQAPAAKGNPLNRLESLIQEASGTPALKADVPLREQLPASVGAAAKDFTPATDPMQSLGGKVTFRREPIMKTVPGLEEGPLRAKAPEEMPRVVPEEVGRQMGAPPTQMNVPFRQQFKVTGMEPASKQVTLEQKYPDRELRQMVHANGEEMVDAIGNDRDTLKAIHDLKNTDVRQALINSGEDMGQTSVGNRKATGDQITRQEAFKKLLAKGHTPQQIVDLAKKTIEEKPGPVRLVSEARREKAGD